MPDQADDLRRFVAEQILPVTALDHAAAMAELDELINGTPGEISPPTRGRSVLAGVVDELAKLSSLPPETAEVYRAKLMTGKWNGAYAPALTDDLITYRRLWLDLKAELGADARGRAAGMSFVDTDESQQARSFLDRMEQAETLAFYAHVPPATPETWESVRDGLRVKR